MPALSGRAELLASLERRMNREDEGIAVALVDLDGFKALNHDHGYAAGDHVLAATLARLQGAVGSGLVARFVGMSDYKTHPDESPAQPSMPD